MVTDNRLLFTCLPLDWVEPVSSILSPHYALWDGNEDPEFDRHDGATPSVAVLSVHTPRLIELVNQLKDKWALPILVLYGEDSPAQRELAWEAGATDVLSVPIDHCCLLRRVELLADLFCTRKENKNLHELLSRRGGPVSAESLGDAVWVLDLDTERFLYASPTLEAIRGYSAREIMNSPMRATMPEAEYELVSVKLAQRADAVRAGKLLPTEPFMVEMLTQKKDGSPIWVEIFSSYWLNPKTGHVESGGAMRDISERKAVELDLARERTFANAVLDSVPGLLYLYDADGNLIRWNKQHEVLTGYSSDELSRMRLQDWYRDSPEDLLAISQGVAQAFSEGYGEAEAYLQTKDGHKILFHFTAVRLEIDGSTYFAGIGIDITQQRLAEEAVERRLIALTSPLESTEGLRFEDLFNIEEIQEIQDAFAEATGVASMITDTEGHPLTRPTRFCDLCQEIIRKTEKGLANCMRSDLTLGQVERHGPIVQPCLSGGLFDGGASICAGDHHIANWLIGQVIDDSQAIDDLMQYADEIGADKQTYREALDRVPRMSLERFQKVSRALYLIARQLSHLALQNVQQARYITERNRAQAELQKAHDELEERVRERTEQLGAANAELEAFSYSVSHDLRAPLRAINGFSGILLKENAEVLDDEAKSHLNRIRSAANHLSDLVDDLLRLSRLTRCELQVSTVDLSGIATRLSLELQESAPERKVEFIIQPDLRVQGDAGLLNAALANLIDNAWKYTSKQESARIEFGMVRRGDLREYFVKDNGAGFDMAYLGKLFLPFERLHSVHEYGGTGIGLATVKRVVARHGGTVRAEGEVGKGATFYFTVG